MQAERTLKIMIVESVRRKYMKPILFSTDVVQAILDERKTVTRRICKDANEYVVLLNNYIDNIQRTYALQNFGDKQHNIVLSIAKCKMPVCKGDILYVRETWYESYGKYYYRADFDSDYLSPYETLSGGYPFECRFYPGCEGCTWISSRIRWNPSIHMPKKAARIFLKVTDVRVERLQDITDEQAIREGFEGIRCDCEGLGYQCTDCYNSGWREPPKVEFMYMWNSTIKKSQLGVYGWDANPWSRGGEVDSANE